jgi:hypothetical protein
MQGVVARIAVQQVVAIFAHDPVVACAAPDRVVAGIPGQIIVTRPADDLVVATPSVHRETEAVVGAVEAVVLVGQDVTLDLRKGDRVGPVRDRPGGVAV